MFLFSKMLDMLVGYANPSGSICLRCLLLTLSGPVELLNGHIMIILIHPSYQES